MVRRYKRFLVDAELTNGSITTMHCANTGAMKSCVYPGYPVYYSTSDNVNRKYPNTVELIQTPDDDLVCVNTSQANRVVKEALGNKLIDSLKHQDFTSEIAIPDEAGRFDFGNEHTFIEVKSVTYLCDGLGLFPDTHSERATKHVNALKRSVLDGKRAVLLFCVPHTGIDRVAIAADIDPVYDAAVAEAMAAGVEVLAFKCDVSTSEVTLAKQIPFVGSSRTHA